MPPDIDFRINKGNDPQKSWLILQQTRAEALKVYYLIVTKILSRIEGISIQQLRQILIYDYLIDQRTIDQAEQLLQNSNEIEYEQATDTINRSLIYRAPRIKVSQFGTYSVWMPTRR